jgi:23S rRNA (cytosine1962-C5)-methyltransferase
MSRGRRTEGEVLTVNGHSDRWLAQGFPWVYPNEVVGGPVRGAGRLVTVVGPAGTARGRALTDVGWLAARMFRSDDGPLDAEWMAGVVAAALARRPAALFPDTDALRLIHGENDGLPGVRVDAWADRLVVTLDSPAVAGLVETLVEVIAAHRPVRSAWLCYRPDPRETLDPAQFRPAPGVVRGEDLRDEVVVRERGLRMAVRPWDGPDVGMYADMREVRRFLEPTWAGRRVLNTFAYTGAFSVAAAVHGAAQVVTVDLARPAIERARRNFELNGLDPAAWGFEVEDTFKLLDRCRRQGVKFDTVIVDPPSFSHSGAEVWSAAQHMPRLVSAAAQVVAPGGWLVLASNQGRVSPHQWRGQVAEGLAKARRPAVELAFFGAAPDFPAAVTFPEGHYLKVGVWAVG